MSAGSFLLLACWCLSSFYLLVFGMGLAGCSDIPLCKPASVADASFVLSGSLPRHYSAYWGSQLSWLGLIFFQAGNPIPNEGRDYLDLVMRSSSLPAYHTTTWLALSVEIQSVERKDPRSIPDAAHSTDWCLRRRRAAPLGHEKQ